MIVKFRNRFHVPGFGRNRFPAGVVKDVPDGLKGKLPKSAEILEDYVDEDEVKSQQEKDLVAGLASSTDEEVLKVAGVSGYAEEKPEEDKVVVSRTAQKK
jgi:hypothetical protein